MICFGTTNMKGFLMFNFPPDRKIKFTAVLSNLENLRAILSFTYCFPVRVYTLCKTELFLTIYKSTFQCCFEKTGTRAGAAIYPRSNFGELRQCSEFGVQEFDRVIVERRCHVISSEGNLNVFHFWEGIITEVAVFSESSSLYFCSIIRQTWYLTAPNAKEPPLLLL